MPPAVQSISPADGASGVSAGTPIVVTFSEPMDAATLTPTAFNLSVGLSPIDFLLALSGNTVTLTPLSPLAYGATYAVTVAASVKDLAGNAMGNAYTVTFSTVALPAIQSTSPANGASGVGVGTLVVITFTEPMDASTLGKTAFSLSSGSTPIDFSLALSGTNATLTPVSFLAYDATYTVTVAASVKDLAGNAMDNPYTTSFSTVALPAGTITVTGAPYSAKCDGTTDDTSAFQTALATLNTAAGGTLYVPAGVCMLRPDVISVRDGVTVLGQQAELRALQGGWAFLWVQGTGITLSGLTVDANGKAVRGIEVGPGTMQLTVQDVTVQNVIQPTDPADPNYNQTPVGIRIEGGGDTMLFERVQVRNVMATHAYAGSRVARGLLIDNAGGGNPSTRVTISDSVFYEVGPKDDGDCVVIQNPPNLSYQANLSVLNNHFERCHKRAIKLQVSGATITNNTIVNPFNGDNPYLTRADIDRGDMYSGISVYANDVAVNQNRIYADMGGAYAYAIEIGAATPLSGISITENALSDGNPKDYTVALIKAVVGVDGLNVTNNTLDFGGVGLALGGVTLTNSTVSGNTITRMAVPVQ